eukprot:11197417-Lingulodinium_polyedra.AAC.1
MTRPPAAIAAWGATARVLSCPAPPATRPRDLMRRGKPAPPRRSTPGTPRAPGPCRAAGAAWRGSRARTARRRLLPRPRRRWTRP